MDEKITIIEGPPPTFEIVNDAWANGIVDSPSIARIAVTQLRTFNGPALVERCHKAWSGRDPINLEFKSPEGLTMEVPIVAARTEDKNDGQVLYLWVRLPEDEIEIEFEFGDFSDDDFDDGDDDGDDPFDLSL
ncbi:MAG: hypothetical protein OEY93_13110 [Anaerolineae bacterium]|nr:hypothetical protein [Anaerolineae bacterium]